MSYLPVCSLGSPPPSPSISRMPAFIVTGPCPALQYIFAPCVCSSHYIVISTRRHTSSTNNQRPCRESSILEEMHVPWPQNYATERDTTYEVRCYACSINKHSSIDSSALLPMQCIISMCVYLHPETISLLIGTIIRTLRTHGTHEELSTFFWLSTFRIAVSLWGQLGANHLKFDWFAPKTTLQS